MRVTVTGALVYHASVKCSLSGYREGRDEFRCQVWFSRRSFVGRCMNAVKLITPAV
jgi:collagenase-like PrtC family protease